MLSILQHVVFICDLQKVIQTNEDKKFISISEKEKIEKDA